MHKGIQPVHAYTTNGGLHAGCLTSYIAPIAAVCCMHEYSMLGHMHLVVIQLINYYTKLYT